MSSSTIGLGLAFTALLCWGFGDFFIQESTRKVGVWKSLFFNDLLATLVLLPFVYQDMLRVNIQSLLLLILLSVVVVFVSVFDFTALREGKLAIVEPLLGIELPITVGLSMFFLEEALHGREIALIVLAFLGIVLASATRLSHLRYHRRLLEKGVLLAGLGAIAMGFMNFLVGVSSNDTSPLLTVWFFSTALTLVSAIYLTLHKEWGTVIPALKKYPGLTAKQAIIDNGAWVAYAGATTLIPISIAATISESYIVIAVLLGIFVNREKIKAHQYLGIALAVISIIALAYLTR